MVSIVEIGVEQLVRMKSVAEDHALIDIRMPFEVMQGGIPGSQNIPMNQLPAIIDQLRGHARVVLYCRSGARSAQACAFLAAQGLDNVVNLRGGIIAWVQSGQAVG
jgi:rhodanese-related sulfurtransferase